MWPQRVNQIIRSSLAKIELQQSFLLSIYPSIIFQSVTIIIVNYTTYFGLCLHASVTLLHTDSIQVSNITTH